MTDSRYWGVMACPFLIGAGVALAMAGLQETNQLVWAVAGNCLTLCFALCLHFRHEARMEAVAQICDGLKHIVVAYLDLEVPTCEPVSSELEESLDSFPRIRGD